MIVIDEMSMVGFKTFSKFSHHISNELGNSLPFGGLGILLSGDFFQLPPVKDFPLYSYPKSKIPEKINEDANKEKQLYNYIVNSNAVVLDVIKCTNNEEYASLQEKVRLGNWDNDVIVRINQRVDAMLTDVSISTEDSDSDYQPILVVRNKTRQQIYESAMIKIANNLKTNQ